MSFIFRVPDPLHGASKSILSNLKNSSNFDASDNNTVAVVPCLFRLYFNELENNSKLNLTFYDDKVNNYEFQFIDKKTTLFDQMQRVNNINNLKSESKKFLNRGIMQGAHDINYAATLAGEIINIEEKNDSLFNEIYTKIQHNEKAALYILRKKLLRQSFLEMNTYNIYLNNLREQHISNPNEKKLLKSYPYIDVFCKMKNN